MKTGFSKGGFNYDDERSHRVVALTTVSLNHLLDAFKDCRFLELNGEATITNTLHSEQIHELGLDINVKKRNWARL